MALTSQEEALIRQLLDQQAAILSLAGNEATITSKLGATKVTLADLVAASTASGTDLLLTRQGTEDKSLTLALLSSFVGVGKVSTTGDQTIGGVKTFSSAPVVPDDAFTFAKLQNIATATILGRSSAGTGDVEALTGAQAQAIIGGVPAGAVSFFAMNTPPTGWLRANGAAVSRTTFAALFAVIGTHYGVGDGSTTFNLPDLRGEFIRGWDDGRGVDSGRVYGSAQADELKSHTHTDGMSASGPFAYHSLGSQSGPAATGATGGTETRPRNIALLACIKF